MELVTLNNGMAVTTSLAISEGTENEHASVIKLVRTYVADLEEFGRVGFEIVPFETAGGMQSREVAILNEQQSTLLLTYMRNSGIVRSFKKALVKAFFEMAQKLRDSQPNFQDPVAAARAWANAMEKRTIAEQQKTLLEHKVAEQAPKVQFHDDVTEAINCQSVQEIAKVLGTGPNRLFKFLRDEGLLMRNNLPYQQHLDAGYFRVIEKPYKDGRGESHTYTRTLVTGKGLAYIHKRINGLTVEIPANDHHSAASA